MEAVLTKKQDKKQQEKKATKNQLLSDRVLAMEASATLAMAAKSRELKAKGIDVIALSLGEPDFETPKHIRTAAYDAIAKGYNKYTPVPGFADLREAISNKFKRDNGLNYKPEQIVVSTGAKQSLANLMLCLLNKGDEAIMPIPYWVSYAAQIKLAGGKVVEIPTSIDTDFKATPEQLEAAITKKTKLFVFSSPCNPSGSVYSKKELEGLAKVLAKHPQIIVISDEIYEHINFVGKHASIGAVKGLKDRVVTVNGLSKGFAMTGWRLGYIGAPLEIAKACTKIQGQFTSGTCAITQRAAIAALGENLEPTYKMKEAFEQRKALVLGHLRDMPGLRVNDPEGAFYFFPDASAFVGKTTPKGEKIKDIDQLCMYILNEGHVAVVTGSAFGNPDCLRISYAASEATLTEAMKRMKKCLADLK